MMSLYVRQMNTGRGFNYLEDWEGSQTDTGDN